MSWRAAWTPALLLVVAAAWTWPAAVTGDILGRHSDGIGAAWFISAAGRLARSVEDPLTGWPAGVSYQRPDSYTLMALALSAPWIAPARVLALVHVLGVTVTAWAGERFARATGAPEGWSILGGLGFACCGLASTALLEGYAYHLLDPWLPLLAWSWLRATGPGGRALHGVAAAVCFMLAVATTAWLGLAAGVLLLGFLAGGLLRRDIGWRPVAAFLATLGPLALGYLVAFLGGGAQEAGAGPNEPARFISQFAWGLVHLAGPDPEVDIYGQSQSANVPAVVLALCLAAPVVLREARGWRTMLLTGLGGLVLALGPRPDVEALASFFPGPVGRAVEAVATAWLRFPERLGWASALCGSAVAARVAGELARRVGPLALTLPALLAVDLFAIHRQPSRQATQLAAAPSAYAAGAGPVLDLWAEDRGLAPAWTLRTTNIGCWYQAAHQRPIADHCLFTYAGASPRLRLGGWVTERLLHGQVEEVAVGLGRLAFASVALHVDSFLPGDRVRLGAALARMDPAPARSSDGGEAIAAYAVPGVEGADPRAAWAAWAWPG